MLNNTSSLILSTFVILLYTCIGCAAKQPEADPFDRVALKDMYEKEVAVKKAELIKCEEKVKKAQMSSPSEDGWEVELRSLYKDKPPEVRERMINAMGAALAHHKYILMDKFYAEKLGDWERTNMMLRGAGGVMVERSGDPIFYNTEQARRIVWEHHQKLYSYQSMIDELLSTRVRVAIELDQILAGQKDNLHKLDVQTRR